MSIEFINVSYTYAPGTSYEAKALTDFSLKIKDGEFLGVMGRTGCGKSTLMQLTAGLISPSSGQIFVDGEDINGKGYDRNKLRKKIGVVFQFPEIQLFESTVAKDVAFGLKHFDWSKEEKATSVRESLAKLGFDYDEVCDKSPLGFSGGEKRRLAIAGVLAAKPEVLILDEPVAGLDPLGREAFLKLLDEMNRGGTTVVMISHSADAIAEHAERIVILKEGRLLKDGSPEEVFSDIEGLSAQGIGTGLVRETADLLSKKGFGIPENTVKYEQLLKAVEGRMKR